MQMFGDKIHGLKQTVDRMWIRPALDQRLGSEEGVGGQELIWIPRLPGLLLTSHYSRVRCFQTMACTALCSCIFLSL